MATEGAAAGLRHVAQRFAHTATLADVHAIEVSVPDATGVVRQRTPGLFITFFRAVS